MPQRSFILGSEWLYYKIYLGAKTADIFLTQTMLPLVVELKQKKLIKKWFFIRYADPGLHLRIRFLVDNTEHIGNIVDLFFQEMRPWLNTDLIWKVQADTYNRELERYGTNTIALSETIFWYYSETTLHFLDMIEGEEGEKLRWLFGLRSIDTLLNAFDYELQEKLVLLDGLRISFGREFNMARPPKKQLDAKFRKERGSIEHFMALTEFNASDYAPIWGILQRFHNNLERIAHQILEIERNGQLQMRKNYLLGSHIHMLMNRLFKSKNRLNEMVCYDFLFRYYKTALAKNKVKPPTAI